MNNDMYYDFPKNNCNHEKYTESKCEWEVEGKKKFNTIRECNTCHALAETKVKILKIV